ncbi:hypothetical protein Tco_0409554 [Tanacetum coccineum]
MSSATSDVTYTSVYTDSEPGRAFWGADYEEISEGGIPRVIVLGYDGLPLQPVAPPSPDYVLGPENLQILPVPQDEDEQPNIPTPSTNITIGLGIPSDPQTSNTYPPKAELRDVRPMTTPSPSSPISLSPTLSGERLARCNGSTCTFTTCNHPSSGLSDPNQTTQDSIHPGLSLSSYLLPRHYHHIPLPPLPPPSIYPPTCLPLDPEESSTARPVRGQGKEKKKKYYGFISTVDAEERRQGIRDVGYGIRDTWVDPAEAVPEIAPMTVGEVNTRVVELAELHERDTQDLYALLEDAQDGLTLQEQDRCGEEAYSLRPWAPFDSHWSHATHQELQTHRDHVYAHETYLQAHQTQLQLQSTLIQTQHQVHETRFHMQQTELAALRETIRRRVVVLREQRGELDSQTRANSRSLGGFWTPNHISDLVVIVLASHWTSIAKY